MHFKYDYEHKSFTLIFSFIIIIIFFFTILVSEIELLFHLYYGDKNEINNPQSACDNDLMLNLGRGGEENAAC